MLMFKRKPWTLTLLATLILAISFAPIVDAKNMEHRGHGVFKRMLKQRSPQGFPDIFNPNGAKDGPGSAADDPPGSVSVEPSGSQPPASQSSSILVPSELIPGLPVSLPGLSQSASVSQPSASSTPSATPTPSPPPVNQPPPSPTSVLDTRGTSTVVHYETQGSAQPSQSPQASGSTSAARVSLAVIIGVASAVGVVIIAWTIFRKWKLGRSKKFDQRLNPIDWQPPSSDDDGIPGARRHSTASSFHSGTGHSSNRGYGSTANPNGPLPDHDFTAGTALAPGGGYADMARGPSPQPQMMETSGYGASMYGHHDQYGGVPLHHQQGYGGPNYYNGNRPY